MNITLTPELEQFVQAQIQSGTYCSTSELFNEALHLLVEREEIRQKRIQAMDDFIQVGMNDIADGKFLSPAEVDADLENLFSEMRKPNA